ncbi:MAG: hypothetical protein AAF436_11050 [Myxococcota bacterium]
MRAWILLVLAAAIACGAPATVVAPPEVAPAAITEEPPPRETPDTRGSETEGATSGNTRPATPRERAAIERLAHAAESVRQLRFNEAITIEVEDETAIGESLREQVEPEELERARKLYGALGLVDPSADLEQMFSDVLAEQVIGYYDPDAQRLVIRDDVIAGLAGGSEPTEIEEARLVLVHELVHALQDQRLGLSESYDVERTADADNAFRAVIEGDATLAMLANTLRGQGIPLSAATRGIEQMGGFIDADAFVQGEKLDGAPAIVRVTLVAPYLRGLQFVAKVHSVGGWPSVNRAHRRPPTTTEQVLHPQKYLDGEPAEGVRVPDIPALIDAGYERIAEDTLGELEIAVYFGQGLESGTNEVAARGWAGDQVAIFARGDDTVAIWWTTWDTEQEAIVATKAAKRVAPRRPTSLTERRGRALLIVRDLPPGLHKPVRRAFQRFAEGVNAAPPPPSGVR